MKRKIDWKCLLVLIVIPLIVGGISGFITRNSIAIYKSLTLPPGAPPGFVFPIVWMILYIFMGIASYLVFSSHHSLKGTALTLYGIQLMVNFFWPIIFFSMQLYLIAFIWIILLIILVAVMLVLFYKINHTAAYLIIPYLLWLIFASYLNYGVFALNMNALLF